MSPAARQIVKRSPARSVRLLHLPHLQKESVEAESSLEADFVHVAALSPRIRHIQHQPFQMQVDARSYTPDYLLRFLDGSAAVVETKPHEKLPRYQELFGSVRSTLAEAGICFLVVTEHHIRINQLADRAKLIRRYAKSPPSIAEQEQALAVVSAYPMGISFKAIIQKRIKRISVLSLIARRLLITDAELSTEDGTLVRLPEAPSKEISDAVQFARWLDA